MSLLLEILFNFISDLFVSVAVDFLFGGEYKKLGKRV